MAGFVRRLAAPVAARLLRRLTGLPASSLESQLAGGIEPTHRSQSKPRPTGRTGFLFHTPELLNHFSCVIDLLPAGSFDLVVCWEAEKSAEMNAAAHRWKTQLITVREALSSGSRYDWLVSNHPVMLGDPSVIRQLAAVNVRFMYAAGKSRWNFGSWNNVYDVILCYGPYHATEFANRTDALIIQMGYPRLDAYFNTPTDSAKLKKRFNCDPEKQTVVWLPTWKGLSSVGLFDRQVSALSASYNVVVKLHPLMPGSEPWRVTALQEYPFTHVITDASDNLPLYRLADFMLFDYGGPPFAGLYTDKRMLLLNVPAAENDELAGPDSPDIALRRTIANVDADSGDIERMLSDDQLWEAQAQQRRALRKLYFAPYYGFSARVAALSLMNLQHILGPRSGA
jgi:hypothetical protein